MIWRRGEEVLVLDNEWLKVKRTVYHREGSAIGHDFYIVHGRDWVHTVPITQNGKIALVREFRHGVADELLGLPGGLIDPTDTLPEDAAVRETREELNISDIIQCRHLGRMNVNSSTHTNIAHSFLIILPKLCSAPPPNTDEPGITPELHDFQAILRASLSDEGLASGFDVAAIFRAAFVIATDMTVPVSDQVRAEVRLAMSTPWPLNSEEAGK